MAHESESFKLVGSFFHVFEDGDLILQGHVMESLGEGDYFVRFFEWFMGGEFAAQIVNIQEMKAWKFYRDDEDMKYYSNAKGHNKKMRALLKPVCTYQDTFAEESKVDDGKTDWDKCLDCGVKVGQYHLDKCDVEECSQCGGQYLTCECEGEIKRLPWSGEW